MVSSSANDVAWVLALVAAEPGDRGSVAGTAGWLQRLCRVAVRELPASGVAVSLITEEGSAGVAAASDANSEGIEALQFTLGEGPSTDAFALRRPVLAPELTRDATSRWPGYARAAHDQGARAVFAFPLQIGAARIGAMGVYRDHAGSLSPACLTSALTFAQAATTTLLDGQEAAGEGEVPGGIDSALESRYEVYQAQGMVMVQLGVGLGEAMARLQAYAYANDRGLTEVASDIVARDLNLDRDRP